MSTRSPEPAPYVFVLSRQLRTDNQDSGLHTAEELAERGAFPRPPPPHRAVAAVHWLQPPARAAPVPGRDDEASMRTPHSRGAAGRMSTSPVGLETPTLKPSLRDHHDYAAAVLADGTLVIWLVLGLSSSPRRTPEIIIWSSLPQLLPPAPLRARRRRRRLRPLFRRWRRRRARRRRRRPAAVGRLPRPPHRRRRRRRRQRRRHGAAVRHRRRPRRRGRAGARHLPRWPRGRRRRPFGVAAPVAAARRHARQQRPRRRMGMRAAGAACHRRRRRDGGGRGGRGAYATWRSTPATAAAWRRERPPPSCSLPPPPPCHRGARPPPEAWATRAAPPPPVADGQWDDVSVFDGGDGGATHIAFGARGGLAVWRARPTPAARSVGGLDRGARGVGCRRRLRCERARAAGWLGGGATDEVGALVVLGRWFGRVWSVRLGGRDGMTRCGGVRPPLPRGVGCGGVGCVRCADGGARGDAGYRRRRRRRRRRPRLDARGTRG